MDPSRKSDWGVPHWKFVVGQGNSATCQWGNTLFPPAALLQVNGDVCSQSSSCSTCNLHTECEKCWARIKNPLNSDSEWWSLRKCGKKCEPDPLIGTDFPRTEMSQLADWARYLVLIYSTTHKCQTSMDTVLSQQGIISFISHDWLKSTCRDRDDRVGNGQTECTGEVQTEIRRVVVPLNGLARLKARY